jgi:SLT domain-containing protein
MKKPNFFYIVISLSLLLFIVACGDKKPQSTENQANSQSIYTLIFIDKTASVDVEKPFVAQKYQQALTSIIEQNINKAGDKFEIYYIHENTSKGRCLSLICRTEMDNTEGMNATDIEAVKTSFDLSIRKERNFVIKQAMTRLNAQNSNASNLETNILSSIPVIAKAAATQSMVKVYYLSDMVESVKNGRDFQQKPPKDDSEAEAWAKTDAEKFKDYALNSPDISMILPFEPTSSIKENNPTITFYWSKLFENLGVMSVQEL